MTESIGKKKETIAHGPSTLSAADLRRIEVQFVSATKQVRELSDFIRIVLSLSPFGVCIFQNGRLIFTNRAFSDMVGFGAGELRGKNPESLVLEEDLDHLRKGILSMLRDQAESSLMFRVVTKDETVKWILGSFAMISMNSQQAVMGNFVDLTEGKVMQMAYSDPLTGLPNRKLLSDRLEQAVLSARRRKARLAVLFIDLDGFKSVNDTYGHDIGDRLLIEIAARLREVVRRENDTIARIGGDEFLILLTDVAESGHVDIVIGHLFEKFRTPVFLEEPALSIPVRFSVGVSFYPDHGESAEALVAAADRAMYAVKKTPGKNSVFFCRD